MMISSKKSNNPVPPSKPVYSIPHLRDCEGREGYFSKFNFFGTRKTCRFRDLWYLEFVRPGILKSEAQISMSSQGFNNCKDIKNG
jgi:hypothetical protein